LISLKELAGRFRSILHRDGVDPLGSPTSDRWAPASEFARELLKRPTGPATSAPTDSDDSRVDPLELSLAVPPGGSVPAVAPDAAPAPGTFGRAGFAVPAAEAALVEQMVRRIVWGGDRRRGVARIDLDGALLGTSIWLRTEGRALEVELVLGPGLDERGLAERLLARLRTRGIEVARCEVR
jgi:hypothetical protein